jgi:type VI secretion system protein ImpK
VSFLLDRFQEFYREVLRLRDRVARGTWVFDAGSGTPSPSSSPSPSESETGTEAADAAPAPSAVWRSLLSLLEGQALEAGRTGGDFAAEIYRRAQYAMAALADETFLHLDWPGREAWRQNLLEARLFGSHRAGEELFARIEELLREPDTVLHELARLYLQVLALGFQGKFRGRPDAERELEAYRRRLFRFIFGRDPKAVRGEERLVPQAYAATLDKGEGAALPHLRPWIWAVILITALWLAAGHLLWRHEIAGIEPLVTDVLSSDQAAAAAERRAGP